MSTIRAVAFDAAGTLIRVDWEPGSFALKIAEQLGWNLPAPAADDFRYRLGSLWNTYVDLNRTRDPELLDRFWFELCRGWLESNEITNFGSYRDAFWNGLYGPDQTVFALYEDSLEVLEELHSLSVPIGIISNWDYSLHRIVDMLGLRSYLQFDLASLEEGPEKPDPHLFNLAADRFGLKTSEILYVGDNPIDDLQGARGAGMSALLVDRTRERVERPYINHLSQAMEMIT